MPVASLSFSPVSIDAKEVWDIWDLRPAEYGCRNGKVGRSQLEPQKPCIIQCLLSVSLHNQLQMLVQGSILNFFIDSPGKKYGRTLWVGLRNDTENESRKREKRVFRGWAWGFAFHVPIPYPQAWTIFGQRYWSSVPGMHTRVPDTRDVEHFKWECPVKATLSSWWIATTTNCENLNLTVCHSHFLPVQHCISVSFPS